MSASYDPRVRRLEELRRELLARFEDVDSEGLNRRPADGGWSAGQVLAHVIEAEAKSLAYVRKRIQDPQSILRRGLRQRINGWAVRVAMRTPFKFEVPPSVGEPPESVDLEALSAEWNEIRRGWQQFVTDFPTELGDRTVYRHPVAGPLTLDAALRFLVAHLDRHSRQIDRALG